MTTSVELLAYSWVISLKQAYESLEREKYSLYRLYGHVFTSVVYWNKQISSQKQISNSSTPQIQTPLHAKLMTK